MLFICRREGETSRAIDEGAGAIIAPLNEGAERARSRLTRAEAGATTTELRAGTAWVRSREMFGAGAMIVESSLGA